MVSIISWIAVGLVLVVAAMINAKKDRSTGGRFDERQVSARGKAFQYGFITFLIGDAVYALLSAEQVPVPVDEGAAMMFIIVLAVGVMGAYSIWNNAYLALNERSGSFFGLFVVACILNLAVGTRNALRDGLYVDGRLTISIANFLCGILFLILLVVMAVRYICDRNSDEE